MIRVLVTSIVLLVWSVTAFAAPDDPFGQALVRQIKREGYSIVSVRTTLLRRVQIDSADSDSRRQTVYNPVTEVILQDMIIPIGERTLISAVSDMLGIGGGDDQTDGNQGKGKGNGKDNPGNGNGNGNSGGGNNGNGNGNSGGGNNGNGKGNNSN